MPAKEVIVLKTGIVIVHVFEAWNSCPNYKNFKGISFAIVHPSLYVSAFSAL